jgi:hypothetical protein
MSHPADKKYTVVKDGKRVGELHETEASAIKEAARERQVSENQGTAGQKPEVKVAQNLLG